MLIANEHVAITVVKTLEEFYSNLSRSFEEPWRVDRCVSGELFGSESKADVFNPGEEWTVLGSPSVAGFAGFIFGEDTKLSEIVADDISELFTPIVFY